MGTGRFSFFDTFRRAPRPATRRPLLKKGSIRKLFCGWATYFLWKGEESERPEPWISGNRSMDTVRRPLCGCFVLSCMVGGTLRKPLGFRRCLPPARPEKALPFQAGRSPCTKHLQTVRLLLYKPKKVFEGSKGRFFKNAPLAGSGTESHGEKSQALLVRARLCRQVEVLSRNAHKIVRLRLHAPRKVFEGSKGRFFKNAPWQGVGQSPTKGDTNTFKGDNHQSRESYEILTKALPNHGRRKKRILLYCRRNKDNEERLRKKVEK